MVHEKSITLKQLRALAAIEKAGSLTAAAEILNVTTPAVSTQLKSLEDNLGAEVARRSPHGQFDVTEIGHEVLSAINDVEGALSRCFRRVESLKSGKSGHIFLGVVSTAKYFAPSLVMKIKRAFPKVELELKLGNRQDIIKNLESDGFDFAIMGRPPRDPVVDAYELGDNPHVLIAPPGHTLANRFHVAPQEILAQTFLTREPGSGTRILMEHYLDRIGEGQPYETYELGTNETIKQAVMAGLGIALISAHTVTAEVETGRLVAIEAQGLPLIRQWYLVNRAHRPLSPTAKNVRDFILSLNGSFLPHL